MKVMHFIADRLLAHPKPIGAGPAALHPNVRPVIHEEYVNKTIDIVCKDIKASRSIKMRGERGDN